MKTAIITLGLGDMSPYMPAINSQKAYADKIGADYFVIGQVRVNYRNFYFEKLQALMLLEGGYDRILYLDGDVLVTPHAKNVFEEYDDPNFFYAFNENKSSESEDMNRDGEIQDLISDIDWPRDERGELVYFNAGIFLISKEQKDVFNGLGEVPDTPTMWKFGDQTALNYMVAQTQTPFRSLDHSFNRMDLAQDDPNNERLNANFIHYAGPCRYATEGRTKFEQMKFDAESLLEVVN